MIPPGEMPQLLVVGIVIPYHADRGVDGRSRQWEEHHRSIPEFAAEWRRLRAAYPDHVFVVAGDYNQSRDGRRWWGNRQWYGTHVGRTALTEALASAGLECVTEEDLVAAGKLEAKSTIDDIALDSGTASCVRYVGAWEPGVGSTGKRLSDHNGIWVDIGGQSPMSAGQGSCLARGTPVARGAPLPQPAV